MKNQIEVKLEDGVLIDTTTTTQIVTTDGYDTEVGITTPL